MFWQKQQGKGSAILRWKNDTQILDFYHTEYKPRELFTCGIKENYSLFNLLLSLTCLNTSYNILQRKMTALNSDQHKTIYLVRV